MSSRSTVDPVTLEIVRNGLKAIAQRITRRMIRSANSFIVKEMEDCSASIFDADGQLLAEEAGPAYKNIDEVIAATELAGISKSVVRFTPIGNVKG